MSYLNHRIGHREALLETRSVVKKENYVVLEVDGLVKNAIPGYENCDAGDGCQFRGLSGDRS